MCAFGGISKPQFCFGGLCECRSRSGGGQQVEWVLVKKDTTTLISWITNILLCEILQNIFQNGDIVQTSPSVQEGKIGEYAITVTYCFRLVLQLLHRDHIRCIRDMLMKESDIRGSALLMGIIFLTQSTTACTEITGTTEGVLKRT